MRKAVRFLGLGDSQSGAAGQAVGWPQMEAMGSLFALEEMRALRRRWMKGPARGEGGQELGLWGL